MACDCPGFVLVAVGLAVSALACGTDGTSSPTRTADETDNREMTDVGDAAEVDSEEDGLESDVDTDVAEPCSPTCTAPNTECVSGRCQCLPDYHDGGDQSDGCVRFGECDSGYGIPENESDCRLIEEFCAQENPCANLTGWDSVCLYEEAPAETECESLDGDLCAIGFECLAGACEPIMPECSDQRPVLLVHGVNGSSADYDVMVDRLIADGWPEDEVFVFDAVDPSWGCNRDNADAIQELVADILETTCHPRIDLVAHSMGTLSTRYFIKNLGGTELVNTYVTLGGMHHGLSSACWAPDFLGVCVWQEICESGDFVDQLNDFPSTPGELNWVSIYGTADDTIPNDSSHLGGAENIVIEGAEHSGANGLLEREDAYLEVLRVLQYPCW